MTSGDTARIAEEAVIQVAEAIKLALEYEGRVHRLYVEAVKAATDEKGKRVFQVMADEERGHIEFLNECLKTWQETGHLKAEELASAIPPREKIELGVERLKERISPSTKKYDIELDHLKQALAVEHETSAFYQRVVEEVEGPGRRLFERFTEIEEGHVAIVQAEIDSLSGFGHWFDHREINLEGA